MVYKMDADNNYNNLSTEFIPDSFMEVAERIVNSGQQAYFVGGAIRDKLLKKEVHDFDLTVSMEPDKVKELLSDYRIIDTGILHGTVTVLTEDGSLEATTFRKDVISDGEDSDHRHPSKVIFGTDLADDLARRDFTVNALALSPDGNLVDLFGGLDDLNHRLIRAVGFAEKRLDEDALRILRALRFASCLGFNIEDSLKKAIFKKKSLLSYLSVERIDSELSRFIRGQEAGRYLIEFKEVFVQLFSSFEILFKSEFWQILIAILRPDLFSGSSFEAKEKSLNGIAELQIDCDRIIYTIFSRTDEKYRYKLLFVLLASADVFEKRYLQSSDKSQFFKLFSVDILSEEILLSELKILGEEIGKRAYDISMSLHGPKNRAILSTVLAENIIEVSPGGLFSAKKRFLKYKKYELDFKDLIQFKFDLFKSINSGIMNETAAFEIAGLIELKLEELDSLLRDFEIEVDENRLIEIKDLAIESGKLISRFNLRGRTISDMLNYLQDCCLEDIRNNSEERLLSLAEAKLKDTENNVL